MKKATFTIFIEDTHTCVGIKCNLETPGFKQHLNESITTITTDFSSSKALLIIIKGEEYYFHLICIRWQIVATNGVDQSLTHLKHPGAPPFIERIASFKQRRSIKIAGRRRHRPSQRRFERQNANALPSQQ